MGTHVADIRDYADLFTFPHKLAADTLREAGLPHHRVGVELGQEQRMGIPTGAYLALVEAMADTEFVDAAGLVISLRMTKSAVELGYMRQAIEATTRARQRLDAGPALADMTEREAARAIRRLILEEGGDDTSFVHFQYDVQAKYPGAKAPFHLDRPLPKGVIIGIDTGAYVGMYTVDFVRMAIFGKPTDAQKRLYATLLRVNRKMADALRPGVKASDIHKALRRAAEDAGVAVEGAGSRAGHGQGMQLTEPPSVSPKDNTVLQPGMVISTEPGIRSGSLGLVWEDTHIITEYGHEQLTLESDALRALTS
jgi:Xaa-Pro aminopeptidase